MPSTIEYFKRMIRKAREAYGVYEDVFREGRKLHLPVS
jgi:hypothetical protein